MSDQSQKTEQPTQHRLIKARREGQFPVSKDLISTIQLAVGLTLLLKTGPSLGDAVGEMTTTLLRQAFSSNQLTIHELIRLGGIIARKPMLLLGEAGIV